MDRRAFFGLVGGATATGFYSSQSFAQERSPHGEPIIKRWTEQRWALDNIIQANGVDWDQGHTSTILRACGVDAMEDMATLKQRVKKYADIVPAMEALARKREAGAKDFESRNELIVARDYYYMAAVYWATAMWGIDEINDRIIFNNTRKRECFSKYMALADHRIEWVEIAYRGKTVPAVFHLPPSYKVGDKVPVIVAVPGMDGFKERSVSLYADGWMQRGVAVLALEGPGYWESPVRGIYVDVKGWSEVGREVAKWLKSRNEIDASKIGVTGSSFGSFFSVALMADEPAFKACAVTGTCYEPGGHSIFEEASPTFKKRFMFMSGITDENEFDVFRKTLDWAQLAPKIKVPYLVAAGESDELCPLIHTEHFIGALDGPKQLVVYQDSRHSLNGPAVSNGPNPRLYQAEWMMARLNGKPMESERWFVEASGKINKSKIS
jgi:dienelactone hydrolase